MEGAQTKKARFGSISAKYSKHPPSPNISREFFEKDDAGSIQEHHMVRRPTFANGQVESAYDRALNTRGIITNANVSEASEDSERTRERRARGRRAQLEAERHRATLKRLKEWYDWEKRHYSSLPAFLLSTLGYPPRPTRPSDSELEQLATFYFRPRADLKVSIYDIGEDRFEVTETNLGNVEKHWRHKPAWVSVRWIHAPVGHGILQKSLEFLFLNAGIASRAAWEKASPDTVLQFEVLHLRNRQFLQDQIDTLNILQHVPHLRFKLDRLNFANDANPGLSETLAWYASDWHAKNDFWHLASSDFPRPLTEDINTGYSYRDPNDVVQIPDLEDQIFSRHFFYEDTVLVRNEFKCFHRGDGFVLTMSSMAGVNYLHKDIKITMRVPSNADAQPEDCFVLEALRQHAPFCNPFEKPGSLRPGAESMEYFLIFLVTELLSTPHAFRQGQNVPEIERAYATIVSGLYKRRTEDFKRKESIDLVREYATCMEEISKIQSMIDNSKEILALLREDCLELETLYCKEEPEANHPLRMTVPRIDWAILKIEENNKRLPAIYQNLRSALDVLFQLRSIEQNQLALIAESNNKAILVFTVVTIIFLPLSFFTSYYGMNLKGIADTEHGQGYFWTICGTTTSIIVCFTIIFGFQDRLYRLVWKDREYSKAPKRRV